MDANLRKAALEYHEHGRPGKISVTPTKQLTNQRDLALAYSPGVAAACEEIVADPANVFRYTARGNLVGVITNGTAVLGLGNIGALASKPVMEGKALPVQEVRRHRRVRHRTGNENRSRTSWSTSSPALEPTLRRRQPGRHQGARNASTVEKQAARAHEDPRLP